MNQGGQMYLCQGVIQHLKFLMSCYSQLLLIGLKCTVDIKRNL